MNIQIVITIVLLLSVVGIAIWFYNEKNSMKRLHDQTISKLEAAIFDNRNQISYRYSHFNKYDFLKYNLQESLVIQGDILINDRFKKE